VTHIPHWKLFQIFSTLLKLAVQRIYGDENDIPLVDGPLSAARRHRCKAAVGGLIDRPTTIEDEDRVLVLCSAAYDIKTVTVPETSSSCGLR
jgi:hypothetical protein